ncbi:hypothetical protein ACWGVM_26590, partial [Streptomyces albidoflavus]
MSTTDTEQPLVEAEAGGMSERTARLVLVAVLLLAMWGVVAAVREEENAPLLRQSGADAVITSASAAGRLL